MKRTNVRSEDRGPNVLTREYQEANLPILSEVLFAAELVLLHAAPIYYGLVACRSEFVTADAAGGIGVFPLDRSGVGGISVDVAAEFAS